jgi:membrane fusion protein, copper/silver efflux system
MTKKVFLILSLIFVGGLYFWRGETSLPGGKQRMDSLPLTTVRMSGEAFAQGKDSGEKSSLAEEVEIPPEKQQMIGVKKATAALRPLTQTIRAVGRIEYDERKLVTINSKVEGWIEKLYVDYTGKFVRKGDPLAEIYSPELLATQLEYINLLKWIKSSPGASSTSPLARRFQRNLEFRWGDRYNTTGLMSSSYPNDLVEIAQQKMKFWDITEEQIKKIEEGGEALRNFTIYSPGQGYVVQKPAVQGKRFDPGEKLFDIADLSSLWVIAEVYVYELPLVKIGQEARIRFGQFPEKVLSAKVDFIYPQVSGDTRTARVRFVIPNKDGQLKPQMFSRVELRVDLGKKLAIPEDALIDTGIKKIVYVEKKEGFFEPREVIPGVRADGMIEIVEGVKEGEKVAASANFLIDSEARLRGVVKE